MISRKQLALATGVLALTTGASSNAYAASLNYFIQATATDRTIDFNGDRETDSILPTPQLSILTDVTASYGGGFATADLFVDMPSGVVGFGAEASAASGAPNEAVSGNGRLNWSITEVFDVVGEGLVTFSASFDGFMTKSPFEFDQSNSSASGGLSIDLDRELLGGNIVNGDFDSDSFSLNTSVLDDLTVNTVLTAQVQVYNGEKLHLTFSGSATATAVSTSGIAANALSNFRNTATLSYTTDPGVSLSASDPSFLAPVPLPAAFPALLSALFALGAVRKSRC